MASASNVPPGHFLLLYFASAAMHTGCDSETFEAPMPLSRLFETLEKKYGGIKSKILDSCLVTVNLEYVDLPETEDDGETGFVIKAGDEVAIIPPVSSG